MNRESREESRFRMVVEAAPNAIIMMDRTGKIALVNSQAETLFGHTRRELAGQSIEVLVPERFRSRHPEYRTSFFAHPQTRPMGAGRDLYGLRKDGSEVPVEIGLNPIETAEGTFVLASIIDISERKRAEQEIQAKNQELETLLYVVSHDLRESLRSIGSFSCIVMEKHAERLDEEGRDFLQRVVRETERVDFLLRDLLALSRARRIDPSNLLRFA